MKNSINGEKNKLKPKYKLYFFDIDNNEEIKALLLTWLWFIPSLLKSREYRTTTVRL